MRSGYTHVMYDHFHFPRNLELKCPYCGAKSHAKNTSVPESIEHFMDISIFIGIWEFKCINCIKTQQLDWDELKEIALWNKIEIRNEIVWAWNSKHLDMIVKRLKNENIENHAWGFFATYINKNWLKNLKKEADWKKIEALIVE